MAWTEVLPMDERVRFVLEVERDELPVAEICRLYGISRKTGYKWIGRYHAEGLEGLRERSRRPLQCPHARPGAGPDLSGAIEASFMGTEEDSGPFGGARRP